MKIQQNLELKKHVGTIHCANSLSLLQRKIANGLLYHAYDDLLIKEEYQISIKELCTLIGYDSHDYKRIRQALIDLLSTVVEWNIIEEGLPEEEGEWNASSIIADASIKGSVCSYSYSGRMKKLLYMPALYGRLNMHVQSKFKSTYGLALYENVIRYQNLKQSPWFELAVFRKLMGVQPDKYTVFRDFKKRVLDKAVEEVNFAANINIEPEFQREKRVVVAIRFLITHKVRETLKVHSVTVKNPMARRLRDDFGLSDDQVQKVMMDYDDDYILEKIILIESSASFKNGTITNLAKYLIHALKKNFQETKSSRLRLQQQQTKAVVAEQLGKQQQRLEQDLSKQYENYLATFIEQKLSTLEESVIQSINEHFEDTIKAVDILYHFYRKEGMENKMLAKEFQRFIRENYSDLFTDLLSLDDFKQQVEFKTTER